MKICFIGDLIGRSGRDAVTRYLPILRKDMGADVIIANVDNASHGMGVLPQTATALLDEGIDVLTGGDHIWDHKETVFKLDSLPRLLRPLNAVKTAPGFGSHLITTATKKTCLVVSLQGRVFLEKHVENPFYAMDMLLEKYQLGRNVHTIFVDFHAEATSEKMALTHYLDGRVTAVIGTHTHVPTADARILPGGTAAQTDVGMTGDYHSVIGVDPQAPISAFRLGFRIERMQPAEGMATLHAVMIDTDDTSGLATQISPLQWGGVLSRDVPAAAL